MSDIHIVLVEPQGPINVGSVCRVMMNFGFKALRLVNPCPAYHSLEARRMALKAESILSDAAIFPTLADAVADCHLIFGTTRRFGKYREDFLSPESAVRQIWSQPPGIRTAFVFGREDRGLHTAELDLCHFFVTIGTDPAYPSLNLSHAVALILYGLKTVENTYPHPETQPIAMPAESRDIELMFQHMRRTLLDIDYLDEQNPDHILRAFRRLWGRGGLTGREVRILQGLWNRIDWMAGQLKKGSP
ncbi:RNA methyltransferase [Desulfosarcina sp. OttesenSCG-928-A07]|nr:RNA methyltransferase [Desulfosarcina sp. OttesenSCG-928-G17]MDL2328597.1 RNA methyltransferase [Desulfosarcina sp. OttesenSCG-928-A07]